MVKLLSALIGDVDGAHIQSLFYTFIWNFARELIEWGYVYTAVPPLYKVTIGTKYYYLQNDAALESFKTLHPGKSMTVNRLKGLGEFSPEELEENLLDPSQRVLKQLTIEDMEATNQLFEDLMGSSATPRKEFIEKNSEKMEVYV